MKLTAEQRKHANAEWERKYSSDVFTEQAKLMFLEGYKSALSTNTAENDKPWGFQCPHCGAQFGVKEHPAEKAINYQKELLEDVVSELDLSDTALETHGPLGTPPAELVRLVLVQKDKEIAMLRAGMTKVEDAWKNSPENTGSYAPLPEDKYQVAKEVVKEYLEDTKYETSRGYIATLESLLLWLRDKGESDEH